MWKGRGFEIGERLLMQWHLHESFFNKTLDSVTGKQSVKCIIISSWECLSLTKDSKLNHRSIQSTQDTSSVY